MVAIGLALSASYAAALPVEKIFSEGFKRLPWGSSLDVIKKQFPGLKQVGSSPDQWTAQSTLSSLPALVAFHLVEGHMARVEGALRATYSKGADGDEDFARVERALQAKYSPPVERKTPGEIPATATLKVRRHSRWVSSESRITLRLMKEPARPWVIRFDYESLDLMNISMKRPAPPPAK